MISRMGVSGCVPGSIVMSKFAPSSSPRSWSVFLNVAVPFTAHTPAVIFFIAVMSNLSGPGAGAAASGLPGGATIGFFSVTRAYSTLSFTYSFSNAAGPL